MAFKVNKSLLRAQNTASVQYKHQYQLLDDEDLNFSPLRCAPPETVDPYTAAAEPARALPVLEIVSSWHEQQLEAEIAQTVTTAPSLTEIIPAITLSDLEDVSLAKTTWESEDYPMALPFVAGEMYARYEGKVLSALPSLPGLPQSQPLTLLPVVRQPAKRPAAARLRAAQNARKARMADNQPGSAAA